MNLKVICKRQFASSLQLNEQDAKVHEREIPLGTRQGPSMVKSRVQARAVRFGTVAPLPGMLYNRNQA